HFLLRVDEDGAEPLEPAHHVVIVDDLVPDVDRGPVLLEQARDDLDRAVDAGAERARGREQDATAHAAHLAVAAASASSARFPSSPARRNPRGERASPRAIPAQSYGPSGLTASQMPCSRRSGVSLTARRTPCRRPLAARTPLSRSTASAPVRSWSARRWAGPSTPREAARTVPCTAPGTPSGSPSQRTPPDSSTTSTASTTVPRGSPSSAPARPNDTTSPSGTPFTPARPTSAVRRPARRAARSSAVVAQAAISRS